MRFNYIQLEKNTESILKIENEKFVALEEQNTQLKEFIKTLEEQNKELREKIKLQEEENKQLEEKNKQLRKKIEMQEEQNKQLEEKNKQLEIKNQKLIKQNQELEVEKKCLKLRLGLKQKDNEKLYEKVREKQEINYARAKNSIDEEEFGYILEEFDLKTDKLGTQEYNEKEEEQTMINSNINNQKYGEVKKLEQVLYGFKTDKLCSQNYNETEEGYEPMIPYYYK